MNDLTILREVVEYLKVHRSTMTVDDVAEFLKVRRSTVYRLVKWAELQPCRIGNDLRLQS